jgi:hypothetical protein
MQQYFPTKCTQYLTAALRSYNGFKLRLAANNIGTSTAYDQTRYGSPHPWSDEMMYCAASLLQATGDTAEYRHWLDEEMPTTPTNYNSFKHWGWVTSGTPWQYAFLAIYYNTNSAVTQAKKTWAYNGLVNYANSEMNHESPFGALTQDEGYNWQIGWHFIWDYMNPVLIGYGVTGNTTYLNRIQKTWNYVLGANAPSRPFITGLGDPQREYRWFVHDLWQVEYSYYFLGTGTGGGWIEPPPGIPIADLQIYAWQNYYDNNSASQEVYPGSTSSLRAIMYSYSDSWNTTNEYVVPNMAAQAFAVLPMLQASTTTNVLNKLRDSKIQMLIYPNPTKGVFIIRIENGKSSKGQLSVYNILGEKVYSQDNTQLNNTTIDLSNQPNGIYSINIKTEQETISKKLIINK